MRSKDSGYRVRISRPATAKWGRSVRATPAQQTRWGLHRSFPLAGFWNQIFNSDVYENWVNPQVAGNGSGVTADGGCAQGFPASASVVIPANGVVVFARA